MFDIRFLDADASDRKGQPHRARLWSWGPYSARGEIVLGSFSEGFRSPIFFWQKADYEAQWLEAASRLVGGVSKTVLVTAMYDPAFGCRLNWWPLYRELDRVYVQNEMPCAETLVPPLDLRKIDESVGERRAGDEDSKPSEWVMRIADFEEYLKRQDDRKTRIPTGHLSRAEAIEILAGAGSRSLREIVKALYDIRDTLRPSDESLLIPLLGHEIGWVVAVALHTLWLCCGQREPLVQAVKTLAWGDERDPEDNPIQEKAIELLGEVARTDRSARNDLFQIAEQSVVGETPWRTAWRTLAHPYGVAWTQDFSWDLILSPEGSASKQIVESVRKAASGPPGDGRREQ